MRWKRREAGICPQQTEMEIVEREGSECRRMKGGETEWWGKGRERVQSVGGGESHACCLSEGEMNV